MPRGAIPNANANGYRHRDGNCGSFGDAYSNRDSDSYRNSNGDTHTYTRYDAEDYSDAEAAADAPPTPVAANADICDCKTGTRETASRVPA